MQLIDAYLEPVREGIQGRPAPGCDVGEGVRTVGREEESCLRVARVTEGGIDRSFVVVVVARA
jgi:hypothetical protein